MSGEGEDISLTALLLAHVPAERREPAHDLAAVETLLREHLEAGRVAWPGVPLAPEALLRHLARHLRAEGSLEDALRQLHGADLYLACACATGEPLALSAFERHVLQRVPSRLGQLSASTVDEVLQVLRQRLLLGQGGAPPRIADYSGRGPLSGWVRIIAVRIAGELVREEGRQELFDEPPEALARMLDRDDPEGALLREDSRQALATALRAALAALSESERALLRLHHLHGLTMDRLAAMYGESRSGVARRVAQARERMLTLTRAELSRRLRLDGHELESLLGLVDSRLDLGLQQLMERSGTPPGGR
ncbi:MAG TPA: sigma-70 family RNA polymerase sigma factor, partial [Archangium sp.]|jgi:RNA polymerase sigma-70 factor (ECF subfamily)|uniref:sigma-70 family RNA polymerase sigma factor n=1 Tax=Archangium sp. TaxID=1872627 RepID=UPI002ED8107B